MARHENKRWNINDAPSQQGRTAVVTGANTGLGFATARILAERGATVVLACRDDDKAAAAARRIIAAAPQAKVDTLHLDLASLTSIHHAADQLRTDHPRLDVLINNAGVLVPRYEQTTDGFELHFGVNHLGPFAFTGLLLDQLLPVPGSRVVTVSSIAHRQGSIHFADLQFHTKFRMMSAYAQSKLANLMFTYELQRRLTSAGAQTIAVAAHPGNAQTDLIRHFPGREKILGSSWLRWATFWLFQSSAMGALAIVRAALDPTVRGGDYYGPPGRLQFTGYPTRVESTEGSHDAAQQRRLWDESERLTGIRWVLSGSPA